MRHLVGFASLCIGDTLSRIMYFLDKGDQLLTAGCDIRGNML